MWHKIQLIGNLTHDPDPKYTKNENKLVVRIPMAVNDWDDNTIWVNVTAWEKLGEVCNEWLSKGDLIFVEGRVNYDKETGEMRIWEDNDGYFRSKLEVNAREVKFLKLKKSKNDVQRGGGSPRQSSRPRARSGGRGRDNRPRSSGRQEGVRDDIPF